MLKFIWRRQLPETLAFSMVQAQRAIKHILEIYERKFLLERICHGFQRSRMQGNSLISSF